MRLIFENEEMAVLSDKEGAQNNVGFITFSDGSSVDIEAHIVENVGPGNILIWDMPMWPTMEKVIREQKVIPSFSHITIRGDMNNIIIRPSEDGDNYFSIGGSEVFSQNCGVSSIDDELYIQTPVIPNNVYVDYSSIWVNGRRLPPQLGEDFGYIEIYCNDIDGLSVNATGQGTIISLVPISHLRISAKGSTSFKLLFLNNAEIDISGSGNLAVSELVGDLYAHVSGSGNIDIPTGLIDHADISISGSGDTTIGALIKSAVLSQSGSGKIIIAQVLDKYKAQNNGSGKIHVMKCGN